MLTDINVLKISDRCKHWNLDFANLLDRGHCGLSENQASNKDRNKKFISREEAEKRNQKGSRWVMRQPFFFQVHSRAKVRFGGGITYHRLGCLKFKF